MRPKINQLWHIAIMGYDTATARRICLDHGGYYCSTLVGSARKLYAGYVFDSEAEANAAADELDQLPAKE